MSTASPSDSDPLLSKHGSGAGKPSSSDDEVRIDLGDEHVHTASSNPPEQRRARPSCLAILVLPARIAVGALSYFAGVGLVKRPGLPRALSVISGCISVVLGQLLVSAAVRHAERRSEEEDERAERVTEERMAWFDAIQAVGKIVDSFTSSVMIRPPPVRQVFLDTSLVRLLHKSLAESNFQRAKRKAPSPEETLSLGRHYLQYAFATYGFLLLKLCGVMDPSYNPMVEGTRGIDVAKYMLRLRDDQIVTSLLDGEAINVPRHFVALDEDRCSIVVAIRGTNSISDVITDLLCENEPFANGYAHSGMKNAAESLFTSLLPTLRSILTKRPKYSIVVTGHSLGAGVAILLTKVLLMNGFCDVKCFAIAPCPVFGPMDKVDTEWSESLECFVNADDLVATLCLASARKLALEMERLSDMGVPIEEKRRIANEHDANALQQLMSKRSNRTRDPREEEVEQLYIPTHHGVHWLIPANDDDPPRQAKETQREAQEHTPPAFLPQREYGSFIARAKMFERMHVTPGCVNAHFLNSYAGAFAGLNISSPERPPPLSPNTNYGGAWYANELG